MGNPKELNAENRENRLTAKGWVVSVSGEMAYVSTERQTGCSGCASQEGCGTASLAKLFAPRNRSPIAVFNALGAKSGDEVLLSMEESHLIKHSFMAYGVPLFGLFIGAGLLQFITQALAMTEASESLTMVGGVLGVVIGWWATKTYYRPEPPVMEKILQAS
jgi:sigma-E factor negative regulatory protein RseC